MSTLRETLSAVLVEAGLDVSVLDGANLPQGEAVWKAGYDGKHLVVTVGRSALTGSHVLASVALSPEQVDAESLSHWCHLLARTYTA